MSRCGTMHALADSVDVAAVCTGSSIAAGCRPFRHNQTGCCCYASGGKRANSSERLAQQNAFPLFIFLMPTAEKADFTPTALRRVSLGPHVSVMSAHLSCDTSLSSQCVAGAVIGAVIRSGLPRYEPRLSPLSLRHTI